jgi:hypothetical protein
MTGGAIDVISAERYYDKMDISQIMLSLRSRPGKLHPYLHGLLRRFGTALSPLPIGPIRGISYREDCYLAMRCLPLYITNRYFILREWVHQLQRPGRGGIDRGNRRSALSGHRLAVRIKVGGCGLELANWVRVPRRLWWWTVILLTRDLIGHPVVSDARCTTGGKRHGKFS